MSKTVRETVIIDRIFRIFNGLTDEALARIWSYVESHVRERLTKKPAAPAPASAGESDAD